MNRLIMFLIAIVLMGVAGFGVMWFGSAPSLESLSDEILSDISDGRYEQVWNEAAPEFRERHTLERFSAVMKDFGSNAGAFREITSSTLGTQEAGLPDSRVLKLDVAYEKANALCEIVFGDTDDGVVLLDLRLRKAPDAGEGTGGKATGGD